jgi:glycine oxidase
MNTKVLIVGGGVIGLSIARELRRRGVERVTIVESGELGSEASWAAAGMLAPNIETEATPDFHRFGCEALESYPAFAEALRSETGIDIGLDRSGTLCLAFDEAESKELAGTFERQRARGVAVEMLTCDDVRSLEPSISPDVRSALLYPRDWQVDNRKLVAALRRSVEILGVEIIEQTKVTGVIRDDDRVTGAITSGGDLSADITVLATGAWTSLIKIGGARLGVDVKPIRGQMISWTLPSRILGHIVYSRRGYVVPRSDGRVLVGATVEDVGFDKSVTDVGIASQRDAGIEILPALADHPIVEQWAGLRPFVSDGLPVLGAVPGLNGLLVATAHFRNGILLAPRTGEIIADMIVDGTVSEYIELYGVDRFVETATATTNS